VIYLIRHTYMRFSMERSSNATSKGQKIMIELGQFWRKLAVQSFICIQSLFYDISTMIEKNKHFFTDLIRSLFFL